MLILGSGGKPWVNKSHWYSVVNLGSPVHSVGSISEQQIAQVAGAGERVGGGGQGQCDAKHLGSEKLKIDLGLSVQWSEVSWMLTNLPFLFPVECQSTESKERRWE